MKKYYFYILGLAVFSAFLLWVLVLRAHSTDNYFKELKDSEQEVSGWAKIR